MLLSFVVATCLITLMPGPSMLLVMMTSIQKNLGAGVKAILGVMVADALLLVLTLSGIGTLLYTSAMAFAVVKWLGAGYLIYLGIKQLRSPVEKSAKDESLSRNPFIQGLGITLLNPKIIGFFIAFFPQFINQNESITDQLMILGPLFLLIVFAVLLVYALFASGIRPMLTSYRGKVVVKNASGLGLVGCGLFATTMKQ